MVTRLLVYIFWLAVKRGLRQATINTCVIPVTLYQILSGLAIQEDKATGCVVPDAFDEPIDIGVGIEVGGTPYDYKPYVWQVTYPDNFSDKK